MERFALGSVGVSTPASAPSRRVPGGSPGGVRRWWHAGRRSRGPPLQAHARDRRPHRGGVEAGASLRLAAAHAGIAQSTLFKWLAEGEQEGARREFSEFSERGGAARAGLLVRLGQTAIAGAMQDPRPALSSMRALFAADPDPPRLEVSGQLQLRDDEAGLRVPCSTATGASALRRSSPPSPATTALTPLHHDR